MKKLLVSVLVLGLGASTAALAQAATDFATVDADGSGDVSLTEAQTVWAELTPEAYAAAAPVGQAELRFHPGTGTT